MNYILIIMMASSYTPTKYYHNVSVTPFKTMAACQKVLEEVAGMVGGPDIAQAKCIEVKE